MTDNVAVGASDRRGRGWALGLLLLLAFLRCPPIFLHGRVWAEESTVLLGFSWTHSFGSALLASHLGYYSLWDNLLGAIAAHWLPLQFAAFLFAWSAVLVLLLTGYFIYEAEFLATRTAKVLGILGLVFCAPSFEVWLNTINSQFYFGLWAAVILLSDASRLKWQRHGALVLAALSGPVTSIVAPLFVLRAFCRRGRYEVTQAIIVSSLAVLQFAVALVASKSMQRVHPAPLSIGAVIFNKEIVLLFLDRLAAKADFYFLRAHVAMTAGVLAVGWIVMVAAFALLALLLRRQRTAIYLLGVALWTAIIEAGLGLGPGVVQMLPAAGERYAYMPNVLIMLAMVVGATAMTGGTRRKIARVLLCMIFASGFLDYVALPLRSKVNYGAEPWRQQVLRWEKDPSLPLQPDPTWWTPIHLPPK